jgi:hypothetical protein
VISGDPNEEEEGRQVLKVIRVIRHPDYSMFEHFNDIALLQVEDKVEITEYVRPACLGVPPAANENAIVTGWGKADFGLYPILLTTRFTSPNQGNNGS